MILKLKPACSCGCDERGEGFWTRQSEWMLYDCADREFREAQESADEDYGDMLRCEERDSGAA